MRENSQSLLGDWGLLFSFLSKRLKIIIHSFINAEKIANEAYMKDCVWHTYNLTVQ